VAWFFTRTYARVIRPGLAQIVPNTLPGDTPLRRRFDQLETAMHDWIAQATLSS
jgi:hypothetical protein